MEKAQMTEQTSAQTVLRFDKGRLPRIKIQIFRCGKKTCHRRFEAWVIDRVEAQIVIQRLSGISCPECGSAKVFMAEGRTLSEDRLDRLEYFGEGYQPSVEARSAWWSAQGERGESSTALFRIATGTGVIVAKNMTPPADASDFKRCMLLLDLIPEWKPLLVSAAESSGAPTSWVSLATHWEELERALLIESPDLDLQGVKTEKFDTLLKEVLDGRQQ